LHGLAGPRALLTGTENLEFELTIKPNDGSLLAARSLQDELNLLMWTPFEGESVPSSDDQPTSPGMPVIVNRQVEINRLAD
jgi:hypothetical protein